MTKHRRPRLVIHAAPTGSQPAAPAKPAADTTPGWLLAALCEFVVIAAAVVGLVAIGVWFDGIANPPLPMGWDCWTRERTTATGPERYRYCDASPGWHVEVSPSAGRVVVPDDARPLRRRYVSD